MLCFAAREKANINPTATKFPRLRNVNAEINKIPIMIILGEKEVLEKKISKLRKDI